MLQQLRERNISRNTEFLESLGISGIVDNSEISTGKQQNDRKRSIHEVSETTKDEMHTKLYGRDAEFRMALSLINLEIVPKSALVVCGPVGCGKRTLCAELMKSVSSPKMWFLCKGYNNVSSFFISLWSCVVDKLKRFHENKTFWNDARPPTNFGEFSRCIKSITADCEHHMKKQPLFGCLFLIHLESTDLIETGLSSKLLRLAELSWPGLQIVCTRSSYRPTAIATHILLLPAITKEDMENILLFMTKRWTGYIGELVCVSIHNDGADVDGTGQDNNTNQAQAVELSIQSFLVQSLPKLMMLSVEIGVVWRFMIHAWTRCQTELQLNHRVSSSKTSNPNRTFQQQQQQKLYAIPTSLVSKVLNEIMTNGCLCVPNRQLPLYKTDFILDSKINAINSASLYRDAPLSWKYLVVAAYLCTVNPKESDIFTFTDTKRGRRKKPLKARQKPTANSNENNNNNGDSGKMTSTEKAVTNAESKLVFSLERLFAVFGQLIGLSGVERIQPSGERAALALGSDVGLRSANVAIDDVSKYFGDTQLFAMISDMVDQGVLLASPHTRPLDTLSLSYQCTMDLTTIQTIANGLSISIQDFIYAKV